MFVRKRAWARCPAGNGKGGGNPKMGGRETRDGDKFSGSSGDLSTPLPRISSAAAGSRKVSCVNAEAERITASGRRMEVALGWRREHSKRWRGGRRPPCRPREGGRWGCSGAAGSQESSRSLEIDGKCKMPYVRWGGRAATRRRPTQKKGEGGSGPGGPLENPQNKRRNVKSGGNTP